MADKNIRTGITQLDDDIKAFFELCESGKLDAAKRVVSDKDVSGDEFSKVIPDSLLRLSMILAGPQYNLLLEGIREASVPLVKQAKSLFEQHFSNLLENKAAASAVRKEINSSSEAEESLDDKTISGIGYYCEWAGTPPELVPSVRIGFRNSRKKILLNSALDWEDLCFVLKNLTDIFVDLLEKGKPLVENKQLDLSEAKIIGKRIAEMLESFEKVKQLAPTYKIEITKDSSKIAKSPKDS